jgi:glucosyl-3-phosphoglycerate phosphatase
MLKPTRVILWRHGQTAWNAEGRVQGQHDAKLDDTGREQARIAARQLALRRPAAIVSSDLSRCSDTAAELAALTGLTPTYDVRLRERGFGDWETLLRAEVAERWPEAFARWVRGEPVDGAGVEATEAVGERMATALGEIAGAHPGGTVVVTTHGGSVRHAIETLLTWPRDVVYTLAPVGNCHWSELRHQPSRGWRLRSYNVGVVAAEPGSAD